jgi:hypothetical protein
MRVVLKRDISYPESRRCLSRRGAEEDRALEAWDAEMIARRILVGGNALRPASQATTLRVRDGEVLVTDGPFAETREQIAG